jgi:hypothetical protein
MVSVTLCAYKRLFYFQFKSSFQMRLRL